MCSIAASEILSLLSSSLGSSVLALKEQLQNPSFFLLISDSKALLPHTSASPASNYLLLIFFNVLDHGVLHSHLELGQEHYCNAMFSPPMAYGTWCRIWLAYSTYCLIILIYRRISRFRSYFLVLFKTSSPRCAIKAHEAPYIVAAL